MNLCLSHFALLFLVSSWGGPRPVVIVGICDLRRSVVLRGRNFLVDTSAPLIDNGFVKEWKMKNFQIKIADRIWSLMLWGQVQIVEFFKLNWVKGERRSGAGSENGLLSRLRFFRTPIFKMPKYFISFTLYLNIGSQNLVQTKGCWMMNCLPLFATLLTFPVETWTQLNI